MTLEVVTGARLRLAPVTLPASHLKIPIHYILYLSKTAKAILLKQIWLLREESVKEDITYNVKNYFTTRIIF